MRFADEKKQDREKLMTTASSNFHDIMVVLDEFVNLCNSLSRKIANITGMSEKQIAILKEINYSQDVCPTNLIRKFNLSQYKIKILIESLIRKGFIERARNDHDKRVWSLQLTQEGQNILSSVNIVRERLITKFTQLPDWHQFQILSTLQHLAEIIEA